MMALFTDKLVLECKSRRPEQLLLMMLVFLFPITAATVNHAATGIFELIILLGFFVAWDERKKLSRYEKYVLVFFSILFFAALLSMINTENMDLGKSRIGKYFLFALIPPAYFYIRKYARDAFISLVYGSIPAAFIMLMVAIYQVEVEHLVRAKGAVYYIAFGDTAVLILCGLLVCLFYFSKNIWFKLLLLSSIVSVFYAMILSGTRGAWIFIPILPLIFLYMLRSRLSKKIVFGVAVFIGLAGALLMQVQGPIRTGMERGVTELEVFQESSQYKGSWGTRIYMWEKVYSLWKTQNSWIGIGVGDYSTEMKAFLMSIKNKGIENGVIMSSYKWHAHNTFLQSLLVTGIVGLLAFVLATLIMPLMLFFKYKESNTVLTKSSRALFVLVITAFIVFGISENWLHARHFISIFIMFLLIPMAVISVENET